MGCHGRSSTHEVMIRCFIISRLQSKCLLVTALSNDATNQFNVLSNIDQDLRSTYWSVIIRLLEAAPPHMNISLLIHRVWGVFMRICTTSYCACWSGLSWPHFTPCFIVSGVIYCIRFVKIILHYIYVFYINQLKEHLKYDLGCSLDLTLLEVK